MELWRHQTSLLSEFPCSLKLPPTHSKWSALFLGLSFPSRQASQPGNGRHWSWESGICRANPELAIDVHVGRVASPWEAREPAGTPDEGLGDPGWPGLLRWLEELRRRGAAEPGAPGLRGALASAVAGHPEAKAAVESGQKSCG